MARQPQGRLKFGRSTMNEGILLKIKRFDTDEAEIIGVVEQMENTNPDIKDNMGHAKRSSAKAGKVPKGVLGALKCKWRGVDFEIGTGFTAEQRKQLWDIRDELPGRLVSFDFQGTGSKGRPRFPSFKGLRDKRDTSPG